jgi:hypothetical protein
MEKASQLQTPAVLSSWLFVESPHFIIIIIIIVIIIIKNAVLWDVVLCRSCVNRRFGGTYPLHLQGAAHLTPVPLSRIFLP